MEKKARLSNPKVVDFTTGKKKLANRSKRLRRYKGPKVKGGADPGFALGFLTGLLCSRAAN